MPAIFLLRSGAATVRGAQDLKAESASLQAFI